MLRKSAECPEETESSMKNRFAKTSLAVFGLLFVSFATQAQTVVTTTQTPSPSQSPAAVAPTPLPEQKAYDEARRIKDPQKKIDALDKVIKDYPEKVQASMARSDSLDVYIKSFPTQTDKIRAAAERMFEPIKSIPVALGSKYLSVATRLMDAG